MTRRETPTVAPLIAVALLILLAIIPIFYPFFRQPNKDSSSDLSSSSRISHAQANLDESVETETTIDRKTETKPFLSDTDSKDTTHTTRDEVGAGIATSDTGIDETGTHTSRDEAGAGIATSDTGIGETTHTSRDEAGAGTATSSTGMGETGTHTSRDEAGAGTATSGTSMGETIHTSKDEAGVGTATSGTGMGETTHTSRDEAGAGSATSSTGMGEITQSGRDEAVATLSPEKNVTKVGRWPPRLPNNNDDWDAIRAAESERANCDIFSGEWVPNPEAPYYTNNTCKEIQEHQNCLKFGRPDKQYLQWKWKPEGCELPVFDPYSFLELVRGKSMAFVGDSVARNHMQSLLCLLSRVEEMVDVSDAKISHFKRYRYPNHNFTIEIFSSPYLVKTMQPDDGSPVNLYLDEFDEKWTTKIEHFDYVIISAGHWFSRPQMFYEQGRLVGCLYCTESHITHLTSDFSYRRAFRTAFRAINSLENYKGITFLRSFAPSHFEGGRWDKGGDCVRKMPFKKGEARLEGYNLEYHKIQVEELKIAEDLGRRRGLKFRLFDVTQAMLLRPDGHPSKYGYWPQENVTWANDCVHWCLPGPVDSWNDFLMEMLKREETA